MPVQITNYFQNLFRPSGVIAKKEIRRLLSPRFSTPASHQAKRFRGISLADAINAALTANAVVGICR
jgi:hypothetical protein